MNRTCTALLLSTITVIAACATVLGIEDFTDVASGGAATSTQTGAGGSGAATPTGTVTGAGEGGGEAPSWQHDWSQSYGSDGGGDGFAKALAVAPPPSNRIVIGGDYTGSIDFGGGSIPSQEPDTEDGYVAVFASDGTHQWTERLGSYAYDHVESVAVDPASDVLVVGRFQNHFEVYAPGGDHWNRNQNHEEIFVVKFAANGDCRWCNLYGDEADQQAALGVATDRNANVFVTGRFRSTVDFGPTVRTADSTDAFILALNPGGVYGADAPLGYGGSQHGYDVAVDAQGLPIVVGAFTGEITSGVHAMGDEWDVFVVKYNADASRAFVKTFGDGEADQADAVATHGEDIVVVGHYRGLIDFGGGALTSAGSRDGFIAKLDGNGEHLWSHSLGGVDDDIAYDVAVSSDGLIAVTGTTMNTAHFGDCVLAGTGADVFILVLDPDGNTVWCERFGESGPQVGRAVAWDSEGAIIIHGNLTRSIDFGGGELVAATDTQEVFVVRFARTGAD